MFDSAEFNPLNRPESQLTPPGNTGPLPVLPEVRIEPVGPEQQPKLLPLDHPETRKIWLVALGNGAVQSWSKEKAAKQKQKLREIAEQEPLNDASRDLSGPYL